MWFEARNPIEAAIDHPTRLVSILRIVNREEQFVDAHMLIVMS